MLGIPDALTFGWYTLGVLKVSPDGRQIAAAPGVTLGEIGCTWILDPDNVARLLAKYRAP